MKGLYEEICSYENLELAFQKARKGKTLKYYVIDFEKNLKNNLLQLKTELLLHSYKPKPLETFILRDPKTRKISKSDFRDRVVHHAICNVIEPIFDKTFIYDSHANRLNKGTLKAIERFDKLKRKVSKNNKKTCYVLKIDIKHYFETVNHAILLRILEKRIKNKRVIWLIKLILTNYKSKEKGKGMPLGNLTSQFFANVYLNELDQFIKHKLRIKYYVRYVDDFVILHYSKKILENYKEEINNFLNENLDLELHPDKSRILKLDNGVDFLGFRIFFHHKLIRRKNIRHFEKKFKKLKELYEKSLVDREKAIEVLEGWLAFVSYANTYKYRRSLMKQFNHCFPIESSILLSDVKKHERVIENKEVGKLKFSCQKTLYLFKKGLKIEEIANKRNLKESTVWEHLAKLIEYNHLSVFKVISKNKILSTLPHIHNKHDKLKKVKNRKNDAFITFDEINCVLAYVKSKNKKRNICSLTSWYQKIYCYRKCYLNKKQRNVCKARFNLLISKNPKLNLKREEFLDLFNKHMSICALLPKKRKKDKNPSKPSSIPQKFDRT